MHRLLLLLISITSSFQVIAANAPIESDRSGNKAPPSMVKKGDCSSGSGPEMAECFIKKRKAAEVTMAKLIAQIRIELIDPEAELAAQNAWLIYREKECGSRSLYEGTWGVMELNACYEDFTRARIKELRLHLCTENGCPARK